MALTVSLRVSADAGNTLILGSDQGLWAPPVTLPRGGYYGSTIDNSGPAPGNGTTYHYLPPTATQNGLHQDKTGVAYFQQLIVTRDAQLTTVSGWCTTAVANSNLYNALYASDTTTGLPTTKICDWFVIPTGSTGLQTATPLATPTLTGGTLYWLAAWFIGTNPIVVGRYGNYGWAPFRNYATAPVTPPPNQLLGVYDNNLTRWGTTTGPASMASVFVPPTVTYTGVGPLYWYGLKNV